MKWYQEFAVEPAEKKSSAPDEPDSVSPWAYAYEGMQLALSMCIFFAAGYSLDRWRHTLPWFTLAGSLLGIFVGLYNFLARFLRK